jgi:hypothetical protein
MRSVNLMALIAILCAAGGVHAEQGDAEASDGDLVRETQNPIADLISVPLQNSMTFNSGPDADEVFNTLNIQPVIPVPVTDKVNIITRTIVPVVSLPWEGGDRKNGLGDILITAFLAPATTDKFVWGMGPVLQIPTATDHRLGSDYWSMGPSAVLVALPGKWVLGGLVSNVWSMGDGGEHATGGVNFFTLQPFINYNLPDGWYLSMSPIITSNWEAASDDRWTVPVGAGFGKLFRLGKLPVNTQAHFYYNAVRPDQIGRYTLRLQVQFLFPR